jgi:hypothetical protein
MSSIAKILSRFGKGIAMSCGFDVGAKELLDNREIAADENELNAMPDIRRADGLKVWVKEIKDLRVWDDAAKEWNSVSNNGDAQVFIDAYDKAEKEVNNG